MPVVAADLPWLPPPATATVAFGFGEASAEGFYGGTEEVELSFGAIDTEVASLRVTYSLTDNLAVDAGMGEETGQAQVLGSVNGETGALAGLIWRLVNEQVSPGAPSVALRVGWLGEGSYNAERVHARGPGVGGYDASISIGKVFREALSFSATLGGRMHEDPIPAVMTAEVTAALLMQPATLDRILGGMEGGVILRASYRREFSTGDLDIADPYTPKLRPSEFPELAREYSRGGVGMAIAAGALEVSAEAFRYMGGRNVGNFTGVAARATLKADLATLLGLL
ncbi:MAG: hypothetical protein F4Y26_12000 [Gammaproteobacteria bacterium]|nr:hypothetical protein [Gammaproteobacteria bacterium]